MEIVLITNDGKRDEIYIPSILGGFRYGMTVTLNAYGPVTVRYVAEYLRMHLNLGRTLEAD